MWSVRRVWGLWRRWKERVWVEEAEGVVERVEAGLGLAGKLGWKDWEGWSGGKGWRAVRARGRRRRESVGGWAIGRPERVSGASGKPWAAGRAGGPNAWAARARERGGGGCGWRSLKHVGLGMV